MRELLLASLGGRQYGIWKDEILSVRDIHALHRIPLSPARIAGIMIDGGKTVTLMDLSVCIGHESPAAIDQGCILLVADGEKTIGFVASGELRTLSVSPELLFPLPDYLKTTVFETCAVHDGISIPIVNISALHSRELKTGNEARGFSHRIAAARSPRDISGAEPIRFFTAAGERYAVSAAGMDEKAAKPGQITPLPGTPGHVRGVTFRDGHLLPVIDLTRRIKRQSGAAGSIMLIAGIADAAFGFLVDRDEGIFSADQVTIKPMPLIARSPWLKHLVVRDGELIPLIDLAMALCVDTGAADETPVWQRYATGSIFPDAFFRRDVEVVEFLLLGVRYALPKVEVEDVIAYRPCRIIPGVAPIVAGVAEHGGEILPVVDLAMMFGRKSLAAAEWRMMLMNNGDFRALVITDAVIGERRLPPDMHRTVPIHLPHKLMYGCYPDGNTVRIILNVEAIAVHFDKSLIQGFMPALSQEMRMSPTSAVYAFPEGKAGPVENVGDRAQSLADVTPIRVVAEPVPEVASPAEFSPAVAKFEQMKEEEAAGFIEWEAADTVAHGTVPEDEPAPLDVFPAAASSASTPEFLAAADGRGADAALEQEYVQEVAGKAIAPEAMTATADTAEHAAPVQDVLSQEPPVEINRARTPAAKRKKTSLEILKASAKNKKKQEASATPVADSLPSEAIHATPSAGSGTPYHLNRKAEPLAAWSVYEEHAAGGAWKRGIAYGAIIAVLMAVVYFSGTPKPVAEKSMQGTEPAKIVQALARPGQSVAETVSAGTVTDPDKEQAELASAKARAGLEAKAQAETGAKAKHEAGKATLQALVLSPLAEEQSEPPRAGKEIRAPLELDIPANKPVEIDVYVVREGDTLWSISEHFTGSPYNYPRIAGENRIAEPDLIFPGQRIRLVK